MSIRSRPAYKAYELLALRDSVSEVAVTLQDFTDDETVKAALNAALRFPFDQSNRIKNDTEHVLKPSASNAALSTAGENARPPGASKETQPNSLAPITATNNGAVKKPSPTPSVKRNKAHKLLEAHGSPPTFRVTAGGHVVWNDFSLGSPRFPQSALQRQKSHVMNPGQAHFGQTPIPNGFVAYTITPSGLKQLCQWVDGTMLPIHYGQNGPLLYLPSPNYPFPAIAGLAPGFLNSPPMPMYHPAPLPPFREGSHTTSTGGKEAQIQYLRDRYATLEREKLEHERREVHIKDKLPPHERAQMIDRKRHLINELDHIRKMIKGLEAPKPLDTELTSRTNMAPQQPYMGYGPFTHPAPLWAYPQGLMPSTFSYAGHSSENNPQTVAPVNIPENMARTFDERGNNVSDGEKPSTGTSTSPQAPTTTLSTLVLDGQSPSSAAIEGSTDQKRSHAVEIKDPRTQSGQKLQSVLDPTSPVYEPGKPISPKTAGSQQNASGGEAERGNHHMHSPSLIHGTSAGYKVGFGPRPEEASDASYTTTDFFPSDAHEHSLRKYEAQHASSREPNSSESIDYGYRYPATPAGVEQFRNVGYPYGMVLPSPSSPLELGHPKAPQPSPADDFRTSSFLRDVNANLDARHKGSGAWSSDVATDGMHSIPREGSAPAAMDHESYDYGKLVRASHRSRSKSTDETKLHTDGFLAGLAHNPMGPNRPAAFIQGYILGLQQSLTMDKRPARSLSNVSVRSERVTPTQPPNTAVPSLRGAGEAGGNPRLSTEDPSMSSTIQDNENVRLAFRSPATYTPTKRHNYGPSPRLKVPAAVSGPARQPLPQRIFSESHGIESRPLACYQPVNNDSSEGLETASHLQLEGLGATSPFLALPLTERSGNQNTSSPTHRDALNEVQMPPPPQYGKVQARQKTRSAPTQSMDGAMDDISRPAMQHSPRAEASKQQEQTYDRQRAEMKSPPTSTMAPGFATPPISPPPRNFSSETSPSKTAGCSPKRFSPSKARAKMHNFLHTGSIRTTAVTEKEPKASGGRRQRSPSPDPANMTQAQKVAWKHMWQQRFADIKDNDKKAKGETNPHVAEYKMRNPLA